MSVTVPTVVIGLGVPAALFATPDFAGLRRIMAIVAMFPGALLLALSLAPFVLGPARRFLRDLRHLLHALRRT